MKETIEIPEEVTPTMDHLELTVEGPNGSVTRRLWYPDISVTVEDGKAGRFEVELKGAINECGAVKPRYSAGADEFEKWEMRFLPARDYGTLVVTTSHGIMSHYEAREAGVGGQVIAYVY